MHLNIGGGNNHGLFKKNASLKNKLLLTVSIIVLVLISIITTQSITELNNRMNVDLEQELTSVGLLTAMNLDSDDIKELLSKKRGK